MQMQSTASSGLGKIQDLINDARCFEVVRSLRWPDGVLCSHCGNERVIKFDREVYVVAGHKGHLLAVKKQAARAEATA